MASKKNIKVSWLIGAVAVLALVSVFGLVLHKKRSGGQASQESPFSRTDVGPKDGLNAQARAKKQQEQDRKTLTNPQSPVSELFGALARLGQAQDPLARQTAVARAGDSDPTVRQAVALALGYFDDAESSSVLSRLRKDPIAKVRTQAIQALGLRKLPAREQTLRALLKDSSLTVSESIAAATSLLKISNDASTRDLAIARLVEISQSSKAPAGVAGSAAMAVVSAAPESPKVRSLLRELAAHSKNPDLVAMSVRQLALVGDPEAKVLAPKLLAHADAQVRAAAVLSIPFACPIDRWSLLEKVMRSDRDRNVVEAALQTLRLMSPAEGKALLSRLVDSGALAGEELSHAKSMIAELSQRPAGSDSCAQAKAGAEAKSATSRASGAPRGT